MFCNNLPNTNRNLSSSALVIRPVRAWSCNCGLSAAGCKLMANGQQLPQPKQTCSNCKQKCWSSDRPNTLASSCTCVGLYPYLYLHLQLYLHLHQHLLRMAAKSVKWVAIPTSPSVQKAPTDFLRAEHISYK